MSTRLTIAPSRSARCGAAACARKNGARAFAPNSSSHCARRRRADRRRIERRRVVDQRIEPAETRRPSRRRVGAAARHRRDRPAARACCRRARAFELGDQRVELRARMAAMQRDVVAGRMQASRDRRADAPRRAGDQCDRAALLRCSTLVFSVPAAMLRPRVARAGRMRALSQNARWSFVESRTARCPTPTKSRIPMRSPR